MILNENQKQVIDFIDGNLAVIATAGSGKTTVLTYRIANLIKNNVNPDNILAVTFSTKARDSIQEKLTHLGISGVHVETFHSFALKIIRSKYGNRHTVWTSRFEKERAIQDIMRSNYIYFNDPPYHQIFPYIAWHKIRMIKPDHAITDGYIGELDGEELKRIYSGYVEYQNLRNLIEFDDFLNLANECLDNSQALLEAYQKQFKYILVDEYQDISASQELLLRKINDYNTMIVGDPLQAIYSFRGGSSKFILDFEKTYDNVTYINLNTNYRCSKEIVDISNKLMEDMDDSKNHNYISPVSYIGSRNPVYLIKSKNQKGEAEHIISEIIPDDDVAILARTNSQLQIFQSALTQQHMSFCMRNGVVFPKQPEIELLISYLRLAYNTDDDEAFCIVFNKPNRWLDKKFLEETKQYASKKSCSLYDAMTHIPRAKWRFKRGIEELKCVIEHLRKTKYKNVSGMVKYLRKQLNIDKYWIKGMTDDDGKEVEKIENMNTFEKMCKEYSSIPELLNGMDTIVESCKEQSNINLMTIHRAKGLEFNTVFIIGFNDGVLPHVRSDDIGDEKRLLYVAMTRAKENLWISSVNNFNGQSSNISEFYELIKSNLKTKRRKNK